MSKTPSVVSSTVPAFLQSANLAGMGNEQVGAGDLAIPQLKVLQPLSPEVLKDKKPAATLYDTMSREHYETMNVINLSYDFNVTIWKKRLKGGGRFGTYDTRKEANEALQYLEGSPADYDISDTGIHKLLMLGDDGKVKTPLIFYCSGTARQFSNNWNTDIAVKLASIGLPRFAGIWKLGVETKSNAKGTWYAPTVEFAGYISDEALFNKARAEFDALAGATDQPKLEHNQT